MSKWWHPIDTPAAEIEPDDYGLVPCPHCMGQGCGRCGWAGVVPGPAPGPDSNETA